MLIKFFFSSILLLTFSFYGFADQQFKLTRYNIKDTMEKMLAYHVENKEFSPLLVKRSFRIFIEQFDRDKIYLLKGELEPFFDLDDQSLNKVIASYHNDQFEKYRQLAAVIESAVRRSQEIRKELKAALIENRKGEGFEFKEYLSYPQTREELKERIRERLEKQITGKLKNRNIEGGNREINEKVFDFLEKKMERFEKEYSDLNEHLLTLHILKAFAKTLDAHTGYYSPKEAFEIRANLKKQFHGVGVVLRQDFDGVFIVSLIEGGPAQKSGKIQMGDQLVAINGTLVSGLAFDQLLEEMQGELGTPLKLLVKRSSKEEEVKLVRERIIMNDERIAVSYEPYADGIIGRIDLPSFYDGGEQVNVERDLKEAVKQLKQEGKLLGLVLDFRENSGGFLHQAVKVSKMFLKGGLIVISKYCDGEVSYSRDVDPRIYYDGPLVILTSKASASAAEIVAQALQDHGVAIVVGDERTYGKGTMQYQTLTDESAKAFFKVTVGRYYTASGRSPQIEGVKADLVVPSLYFPYPIGERYLEFPLSNDHLSGEVFHSLEEIGRGTYQDLSKFPVPYLSPRESNWRKMLAILKRSSSQRLAKDKNFQFFLKTARQKQVERQSPSSQGASTPSNHGENDLQMAEAVQIIKDMVYLDRHTPSY